MQEPLTKQPEIYIFDDSFSALDFKTDAALRKALKEETEEATTLIVAQRISTILHADRILVLDEGKVVGMGTQQRTSDSPARYISRLHVHSCHRRNWIMSENSRRPSRGPMGRGRMNGEKAKDFSGAVKKIAALYE